MSLIILYEGGKGMNKIFILILNVLFIFGGIMIQIIENSVKENNAAAEAAKKMQGELKVSGYID